MNKYKILKDGFNLPDDSIIRYGNDKFKLNLKYLSDLTNNKEAKLILVTSINPTLAGEGKTTVSIGLAAGLKLLNKKVALSLREPSLGPVFGRKGGATGGGKTYLEPSLEIDLHFTGDMHAITSANNLISSLIDQHLFYGNQLKIKEVTWNRCIDINDRSLREVEAGLRKDKFVLTAASEIMAIASLSVSFKDLKQRISNIIIGENEEGNFVKLADLGGVDAVCLLLKDAINPNVVFSNEQVPAIVHMGPFANIAHGCSSVIGTNLGLKLADYVVTEAGFGADLGLEKFLHIKQPLLDRKVDLTVVVVTIKAIMQHSVLEQSATKLEHLASGIANVEKHLENIKNFGLNFVVALNHHQNDTDEELAWFETWAKANQINYEVAYGYSQGGKGMIKLASLVLQQVDQNNHFVKTYQLSDSIETKISKIATMVYGAATVSFSKKAKDKLIKYQSFNYPICIAKTPSSLSGDAKLVGRPTNFNLEITDVTLSNGAQIIVAKTKGILLLPGLNEHPRAYDVVIDDQGELVSW